jgi:hypothetical protein
MSVAAEPMAASRPKNLFIPSSAHALVKTGHEALIPEFMAANPEKMVRTNPAARPGVRGGTVSGLG